MCVCAYWRRFQNEAATYTAARIMFYHWLNLAAYSLWRNDCAVMILVHYLFFYYLLCTRKWTAYGLIPDSHAHLLNKSACALCLVSRVFSPSPSSLMDLGSETVKHCMVSYFCASCSCASSGFTSMRQVNEWLFLLEPSLDHGTPFTDTKQH